MVPHLVRAWSAYKNREYAHFITPVFTHIHTLTHTHTHIHIHMCTHIHTHTHMHTLQALGLSLLGSLPF